MVLQYFWIRLLQCLDGTATVLDWIAAVFRWDCSSIRFGLQLKWGLTEYEYLDIAQISMNKNWHGTK